MAIPQFGSWQEILDHYHQFLSGEIEECPTHGGPLDGEDDEDDETEEIQSDLLELNRLGVLTVDSQPGVWKRHNWRKIFIDDEEVEATDVEFLQRAYLDCYMPEQLFFKLCKKLAASQLLVFGQKWAPADSGIPQMNIPVTITRYTLKRESYEDQDTWLPVGYHADDMEHILERSSPEVKGEVLKDLYSVRILDPAWNGSQQLFYMVWKALK